MFARRRPGPARFLGRLFSILLVAVVILSCTTAPGVREQRSDAAVTRDGERPVRSAESPGTGRAPGDNGNGDAPGRGRADQPDRSDYPGRRGPRPALQDVQEIVDRHLAEMTPREKIAQRFVVYLPRDVSAARPDSLAGIKQLLIREQPAGVILYPWNYDSLGTAMDLTTYIQGIAELHGNAGQFLICADQEGGRVAALRFPELVRIPSAFRVGSYEDPEFVEAVAYVTAVQMAEAGFNMNLAPVLDLSAVPDSSIIGDRSFGPDPNLVSDAARAYIAGFERAGVISTAKHYPGHGVTRVDSHGRLPSVTLTMAELKDSHVRPFAAAIDAGVPAVMTAHILFPLIDQEYPVTLSEVFLQGLLRKELGFEGVVISDGLEMGALANNYDLDVTLERAIRFGVDLILLYTRYDLTDVIDRTEQLLADGGITQKQIEEGARRVLTLKATYGLLR